MAMRERRHLNRGNMRLKRLFIYSYDCLIDFSHNHHSPKTHVCVLPVNILAVVDHLQQLLLANVLHHYHGADPENIRKAIVDDAVGWTVISALKTQAEEF